MSSYHIALLAAAIVAAGLSFNRPRALLWIACLVVSGIVSALYLYQAPNAWLPASGIAMLCDAAILVAVREYGRKAWETKWLSLILMASVTVNLAYATGVVIGWPPLIPAILYASLLEIINYAALLIIVSPSILEWIGGRVGGYTIFGISLRGFLQINRRLQEKTGPRHFGPAQR